MGKPKKEDKDMMETVLAIIIGKKPKKPKKKKGEKSLADKINFSKGGMAMKTFKPCKGCPTPANCGAVKGCQNKGK